MSNSNNEKRKAESWAWLKIKKYTKDDVQTGYFKEGFERFYIEVGDDWFYVERNEESGEVNNNFDGFLSFEEALEKLPEVAQRFYDFCNPYLVEK